MCYSVESSLKTSTISFLAIVYLLSSNIPYYQWFGIVLIGWCGMQFDELLLWLTEPRTECTKWNEIITMTLIPFTLVSQPVFALWGSLYIIPWNKSTNLRKQFMIFYTLLCILIIYFIHFYKPDKTCTTVTKDGHLSWGSTKYVSDTAIFTPIWAFIIALPILLFWKKNYMLLLLLAILPTIGYQYGKYTDAQGSIWCYYTSYTSIIASVALFLHQTKIYSII